MNEVIGSYQPNFDPMHKSWLQGKQNLVWKDNGDSHNAFRVNSIMTKGPGRLHFQVLNTNHHHKILLSGAINFTMNTCLARDIVILFIFYTLYTYCISLIIITRLSAMISLKISRIVSFLFLFV